MKTFTALVGLVAFSLYGCGGGCDEDEMAKCITDKTPAPGDSGDACAAAERLQDCHRP